MVSGFFSDLMREMKVLDLFLVEKGVVEFGFKIDGQNGRGGEIGVLVWRREVGVWICRELKPSRSRERDDVVIAFKDV